LVERVAAEEAEKNFQARLECWNHEIELSTLSLVEQLESLLTYESPGWLVDAAVLHSHATTSSEIDVTGMFGSAGKDVEENEGEGSGGLGIAGLGDSPHSRKLQMVILRETCLREVVFMLIKVFKLTGRHAECVRLADLVADSQLGIFKLIWYYNHNTNANEPFLYRIFQTDMREYGMGWIESKRGKDSLDADGRVLQIARVRNIAVSQTEEDFQTCSDSTGSGSRLLRLTLTDGKSNVLALDVDNSPKLSTQTPPGTKIRLSGCVQIRVGFLILRRNNFEVLQGSVELLCREWLLTRDAKGTRRSHRIGPDAPPPFVSFGTPEALAMIDSHNEFLNSLRSRNHRPKDTFDSLKLAMNATSRVGVAPTEDDSDFQQKRRVVVANAQSSLSTGTTALVQHKFKVGGSRYVLSSFQQARADMAAERNANLAQPQKANTAFEESKNSLDGAIYRLTARQSDRNLSLSYRGRAGVERGRGRGRRGAERGESLNLDIEEDPRFDPVAAAEQAGLRGKPSSGPVPLSEFMDQPLPKRPGSSKPPMTTPSSSTVVASEPTRPHLAPNTILLARVMSGDYETARLIGLLPTKVVGEHVALVTYLESGEQEEVPISMLRTLGNAEVGFAP
uniref:Nuclear pore complex protein n=1 Tax=Taenia asiatica TaxID=60517 RepID=A0A158R734_TAEAS